MKRVILVLFSIGFSLCVSAQGWGQTYGTSGDESGFCVQQTSDGGYILSGHSDPLEGTWLIKTDDNGDTLWTQSFTERFLLGGLCVQQTVDGGYIVTNGGRLIKTNSSGDSVWGNDPPLRWSQVEWVEQTYDGGYVAAGWTGESIGEDDRTYFMIGRLNPDGSLLWSWPYGGIPDKLDGGACVKETSDRGFIASGWRANTAELWIIRTDSLGMMQWDYHDADLGWGSSVLECSDGGFLVTAVTHLVKLTSAGELEWEKAIGEGQDKFYYAVQTPDAGFAVTGIKYLSAHSSTPIGGDMWLCKANHSGNVMWEQIHGGALMDIGYCIQNTTDGGYIVIGATESEGAGGLDVYLVKTNEDGIAQIAGEVTESEWSIEQPIAPRIILSYSNRPDGFTAHVYDAAGRKIDELVSETSTGVIEWGENQPPGVYFIREVAHTALTRKIIVTN